MNALESGWINVVLKVKGEIMWENNIKMTEM